MSPRTGGEVLVAQLLHHDVRRVFCVPGESYLPALDALRDELAQTLPPQRAAGIVHGDYRLDNTILHPTSPGRIVAVLDWEMSTLGDPLTDLGTLLA